MGIEELISEIEQEAKSNIDQQRQDTKKECKIILDQAKKQAHEELEEVLSEANLQADQKGQAVLSTARSEAKRIIGHAKQDLLERTINETLKTLSERANEDNYISSLEKVVKNAKDELDNDIICYANERDSLHLKKLGYDVETIECLGGVKVSTKDGVKSIDATFDRLVKEKKEDIRKILYLRLLNEL